MLGLTLHTATAFLESSDVGLNAGRSSQLILQQIPAKRGGREGGGERKERQGRGEREGRGQKERNRQTTVIASELT